MINRPYGIGLVTAAALVASPAMADVNTDISAEAQRLLQECVQKYDGKKVDLDSTVQCRKDVNSAAELLRQYDHTRAQLDERLQAMLAETGNGVAQRQCLDVAALQEVIADARSHYKREFNEVDHLPTIGGFHSYETVKAAVFKVLDGLEEQVSNVECMR